MAAVLCASLFHASSAQVAKRRAISKGPRALGLVEVDAQGRGHLVPVTIMIDGKFYDASVYKADPVPMALQPGTVYEGLKAGVSQGLFTVSNPLPQHGWLGLGSWKTNEQIAAEKEKAKARSAKLAEKPADDFKAGGPPRLSRTPEGAHPKAAETTLTPETTQSRLTATSLPRRAFDRKGNRNAPRMGQSAGCCTYRRRGFELKRSTCLGHLPRTLASTKSSPYSLTLAC